MAQNRYPTYTTYEPGAAFVNGPIDALPRSFDGHSGPLQPGLKQMEPGMQAILDGDHGSRHAISRPFDAYTYPGCEASFHGTSSSIDQGLQALLSGHRPYTSPRDTSMTYTNPIANFYHDADGPWNSVRATSQAHGSTANATLTVPVPNLDYNSYRDAPASEITDSGYASQAAASQSIVNTNTEPTDYSRECGDMPVQVNSFSFTAASSSSPPYDLPPFQTRNADEPDARLARRPEHPKDSLQCPRCGESAKCPSDFKKHQLKHTKPWTCDEPDCTRKEGFTTINDLNRHKKSVHKVVGMTKSFRCASDRCKNKDKIWPRLDNFKQHVRRMHSEDNEEELIQRSQCFGNLASADPDPPRAESVSMMENALAGIDSKSGNLDVAHHKDSPDLSKSQDRNEDSSIGLIPDAKSSSPNEHSDSDPRRWKQANTQQYRGQSGQPLPNPKVQKPTQSTQPDAPKLRELAAAATAISHTPNQRVSRSDSKAEESSVQSPKRISAAEDLQKQFLSRFSNIIASSIANSAANESLNKAVLRALLELEQNQNIITTAPQRGHSTSKEFKTSKNNGRSTPGFRGPDGTETVMSTAEVKTGLATLSKRIMKSASAKRNNSMPNSKTGTTQGFKCPDCPVIMRRRCELNKHRKRHTRPYGCTFPKCYKEFGSKSDWRRHEGSQHWQLETWRCEHPEDNGLNISSASSSPARDASSTTTATSNRPPKVCGDLFYDKKAFSIHLRSQHSLADARISRELCDRRIGRNMQSRFWCGFCERVLGLKNRGAEAWYERFNHIDDHFKQGMHIRDWLDVESKKCKGTVDQRKKAPRNFADGEDSSSAAAGADGTEESEDGEEVESPDALKKVAKVAGADVLILTVPRGKNGNGGEGDSGSDGGSGGGNGGGDPTVIAGKKRSHKEMEGDDGVGSGGGGNVAPDGKTRQPHRKDNKGETLFFCCRCNQGPYAWSLYQNCLDCEHEFCWRCDRRRHESSAEENVDYNLWNHIVAGSQG